MVHEGIIFTDPRELLMAGKQVQIRAVSCEPFAVVVQAKDLVVGKRDAANGVTPAIVAILVLIDVVTKMNHVVNRVLADVTKHSLQACGDSTNLADRIAICVEESKWIVGTRVDSEANLRNIVVSIWGCLSASKRTLVIRVADSKLIVICRVWLQILCFNLCSVRS
jgi:hypothetical protein